MIAGGGRVDLLEGDPSPEWIFIIEFPTADAARRWYQSDDYQEALKVRRAASHGRVFLIEGPKFNCAPGGRFGPREGLNLFRARCSPACLRDRWAGEFGVGIGEYHGVFRVPRRVFQHLLPEWPAPEKCVEAYYLQRTWFESIAERKLRRRQWTEDGNV